MRRLARPNLQLGLDRDRLAVAHDRQRDRVADIVVVDDPRELPDVAHLDAVDGNDHVAAAGQAAAVRNAGPGETCAVRSAAGSSPATIAGNPGAHIRGESPPS